MHPRSPAASLPLIPNGPQALAWPGMEKEGEDAFRGLPTQAPCAAWGLGARQHRPSALSKIFNHSDRDHDNVDDDDDDGGDGDGAGEGVNDDADDVDVAWVFSEC